MDFEFTPDQRQMQESIRALLATRYDLARLRQITDEKGFDETLWQALAEAGVFAVMVPEAHDGLGLAPVDAVLLVEEFGRALAPAPVVETMLAAVLIARFGTPDQQATYLPRIAGGALRVTLAHAEAEAGPGSEDIGLRAVEQGNAWKLHGAKILVPNAGVADLLLVTARFGEAGQLGIALCEPGATGLTRREQATLDLASRHHALEFAGVVADVLGGTPDAAAVELLVDLGAAAAAAEMAGIASRVLDDSVAYAAQRVQFGKPIGSFQAIKHKCADIATAVEGARSAAYGAALAMSGTGDTIKPVSIAKAFAGETARRACNDAIQIHGGIGFTWDLGLHLWLRRTRLLETTYGDVAWHQERVLARSLVELGLGG
ncbi:acyl-CoA dehydrogenase family protein [Falsiroseomonas sp. HW251]|uniref:acyl-CoA dehydrogenase family protein n=1 Tax=Falsiroseomonas sp. HW251 TaxID=3390998 RepID=UPI003D31D64C